MLAQLQHGLVNEVIKCTPRYAFYQALPSHVSRAVGLEAWDQAGPRYMLDKEGRIVARGHFYDEREPGFHAALRESIKSCLTMRDILWKRPHCTGDCFTCGVQSRVGILLFSQESLVNPAVF